MRKIEQIVQFMCGNNEIEKLSYQHYKNDLSRKLIKYCLFQSKADKLCSNIKFRFFV